MGFPLVGIEKVRAEVILPLQLRAVGRLGQSPVQGIQSRIHLGDMLCAEGIFLLPVEIGNIDAVADVRQIVVGIAVIENGVIFPYAVFQFLQGLGIFRSGAGGIQGLLMGSQVGPGVFHIPIGGVVVPVFGKRAAGEQQRQYQQQRSEPFHGKSPLSFIIPHPFFAGKQKRLYKAGRQR